MNNYINEMVAEVYEKSPLNRFRDVSYIKDKVNTLTTRERIQFLLRSFKLYDYNFNYELCLCIPDLWRNFSVIDWKILVLGMFPRKVKYIEGDFRDMSTGCFFDIALLNGIIGFSPFDFIFYNSSIAKEEKVNLFNFLRVFGESYWELETKTVESINDYFESSVLCDILLVKTQLACSTLLGKYYNYREFLLKFEYIVWSV